METINFTIQGQHEAHQGEAVIVPSYNEGTIYAENNIPVIGSLKTKKIGTYEGYDVYENYYDSGSVDYSYFAVETNN